MRAASFPTSPAGTRRSATNGCSRTIQGRLGARARRHRCGCRGRRDATRTRAPSPLSDPRRRLGHRAARLGRRDLRPPPDPHDRMGAGGARAVAAPGRRTGARRRLRYRPGDRSAPRTPAPRRRSSPWTHRRRWSPRRGRTARRRPHDLPGRQDLLEPIPIEPGRRRSCRRRPSIGSLDHDAAVRESRRRAAAGRGQLAAQCGGVGNLAAGRTRAAERAAGIDLTATKRYRDRGRDAGPGSRRAGFTDIEGWLHRSADRAARRGARAVSANGDASAARSRADAPGGRGQFVHAVATELGEPSIDYVRLNIVARMG